LNKGISLQPVTVDNINGFVRLLDMKATPSVNDANFPEGWVNFYRVDDFSAVSYFYLKKAESKLPSLPSIETRLKNVKTAP
jgi:hypothetical protein